MSQTKLRLQKRMEILKKIDEVRAEAEDSGIGAAIEKHVLDAELFDLMIATRIAEICV